MSAATLRVPARQPFGNVSQARLRNLTNTKNTQNGSYPALALIPRVDKGIHPLTLVVALPSNVGSSLKRPAPGFSDTDIENVDPVLFQSLSKKEGTFDFNTPELIKAPRFTLTTFQPANSIPAPSPVNRKRKAEELPSGPEHSQVKRRAQPAAAPQAAAGRSPPKNKRNGLLSRRRALGGSVSRIDPPASSKAPFTLAEALSGTIPVKSKSKQSKKAWDFNIYEDTPDEHAANLMEHGACVLDISDDESGSPSKGDRDNKENIPPTGYTVGTMPPVSRRDMMTDDVRAPLSSLDAKDFYADGCDATSVIFVPADDTDPAEEKTISSEVLKSSLSIDTILTPLQETEEKQSEVANFEIWESESAKDEGESKQETVL
ncbi:MAG: hypothetical protein OHK93_004022 [Ramalina farinacea]|uniref:Thymidylate kinase n=1 Tax=Ramalina farinacea TaxID=258253 RepID=A0AA43QFZ4_9LECA|nr:hypothetical protein [Ramalina farinacea]